MTASDRLAGRVVRFARLLRAAGLPAGTDRAILALRAIGAAGLSTREDFRSVLAACLVDRVEHRELFDEAFNLYWSGDPRGVGDEAEPPGLPGPRGSESPPRRRLLDALRAASGRAPAGDAPAQAREVDATPSFSALEVLRKTDFDSMSRDEWRAALGLVSRWRALLPRVRTRRYEPAASGTRLDWRRIAARSARRGGELAETCWRRPRMQPTPVVALVDISGSMSRYSRIFLHFLHALTGAHRGTSSFVFGTRLTPVSRLLRRADPDRAIEECVRAVDDWSGGTRISACLREFNLRWSRRVLGRNATVLLVTDGLERDDAGRLAFEAERLSKSCHRLLWLNPLLRYEGFEPRAAGIRALLPHVDRHLPVHNLESLEGLADALSALSRRARPDHPNAAPRSIPRWN